MQQSARDRKMANSEIEVLEGSIWAKEAEGSRTVSEISDSHKSGRGFPSRVSAFFRGRKKSKNKRKPKGKSKAKKKPKKKPKKPKAVPPPVVKKMTTVDVQPVRSPRIKKPKTPKVAAGFVLKRKNKRHIK
jgi:hypothetical protein